MELDPQVSPEEIMSREVELDPQVSPEEIMSREVRGARLRKLDFSVSLRITHSSTVVQRTHTPRTAAFRHLP